MADRAQSIERVAREAFGFAELRPGQLEAIEAVLAGRDTLVVMSTGSGKSAIYQIAGLLTPGATVVVSPLIALQRDQVEALARRAAGGAAQLNSTVARAEREEALAELAEDALEFLFLAPEQLANPDVLAELAVARPSLLVVDEAHSISEWGHDFRPDYLRLGAAAEALGRPTVLALTATAAPPVRDEIAERLGMRDPIVLVRGFDRPNIRLEVTSFHGEHAADRKQRALVERIAAADPPGIVYVATRKESSALAERLCEAGVRAAAYHAGMRGAERDAVQTRFMDGDVDVVCATTAFGMGIDKADVRWVFHAEVSESLDAYYQEIGRGGRDGTPAEAVLFYRPEDVGLRRFFAGGGQVEVDEIAGVLDTIAGHDGPVEPSELQAVTALSETKLTTAVSRLEEAGAVAVLPSGEIAVAADPPAHADAILAAAEVEEKHRSFERSRVDMMRAYAEAPHCRRAFILSYFGEPFAPPCGHCDNCEAGHGVPPVGDEEPFAVGSRVAHGQWGEGVVQRYDEDAIVVLFDEVGYKTLALDVVRDRDLLSAA
jgi:ATP-dependent DNA helicase RecQ